MTYTTENDEITLVGMLAERGKDASTDPSCTSWDLEVMDYAKSYLGPSAY